MDYNAIYNAIFERAKAILLKPKDTWPVIKDEVTTITDIFKGYVGILAALPAIAGFLGRWIFGVSIPFWGHYRVGFFEGLTGAIITYILTLLGVYLGALVIDALAPTFKANKSNINALKVVAYSLTAYWVAGIVTIIPAFSIVAFLGFIYSLYLLYVGLPYLMECPAEKALAYTISVSVVIIVVFIVIGIISGSVLSIPSGMP